MQFTKIALATILSATALAAPTPATATSAMANVAEWTIEGLKRVCNAADTSCTWSFAIDTHTAAATPCSFTVKSGAKPAHATDSSGNICGPYTIGSGWSNYFGAGNEFTTLSVINYNAKLIIWPSYTDKVLANGAVAPDLSFAPSTLQL
ncbi:small secreted protein [Hypoxylon sp. NC1633]|nr:small secreted protein [Hypoxylon sp. NC1633]